MQLRLVHLAVAALTVLAALTSITTDDAGAGPAADRPVSRFTAYQACQAAMWKWTADNAEIGTSVAKFRHTYRAEDVWREGHGWHVLVGGKRGEAVTANNNVDQCVITGTNAHPKLTSYTFPR